MGVLCGGWGKGECVCAHMCVHVHMCAHVCVCVCVCVCACMHACARARVCMFLVPSSLSVSCLGREGTEPL